MSPENSKKTLQIINAAVFVVAAIICAHMRIEGLSGWTGIPVDGSFGGPYGTLAFDAMFLSGMIGFGMFAKR